MNQAVIHLHPSGPLLALVGNPNCGKTAIFNLLTGSRQKVANYAGVTVERKEGRLTTPAGKSLRVLDLPGAYSLYPRSPDERVTCDVLFGRAVGELVERTGGGGCHGGPRDAHANEILSQLRPLRGAG